MARKILPKLHPGQIEVVKSPARFKVLACGRRWGKTLLMASIATKAASEGKRVWCVAPVYSMGEELLKYAKQLARQLPRTEARERAIRFPGGGQIEVRSGDDPDKLRGSGLDLLLLDEATGLNPSIWTEVLRPALADHRGHALFASTPRGVGSWFHGAYLLGQEPEQTQWKSWKFPTSSNPHIPPDEIESARLAPGMTDRIFAQEYLGEFLDSEGVVFRHVIDRSTAEPKTGSGQDYAGFIDLAEVHDATAVAVFYWDHGIDQAVQVHCDRWQRADWDITLERLKAKLRSYPGRWAMDTTGQLHASRFLQDLRKDGGYVEPLTFTHKFKVTVVQNMTAMLERNEVQLLRPGSSREAEIQRGELLAFTATQGAGHLIRYGAPPGQHDDAAIACITAAWLCRREYGDPIDTTAVQRAMEAMY